jgi:hypothetical protein
VVGPGSAKHNGGLKTRTAGLVLVCADCVGGGRWEGAEGAEGAVHTATAAAGGMICSGTWRWC